MSGWVIVLTPHLPPYLDEIINNSQSQSLYDSFGGSDCLEEFKVGFKSQILDAYEWAAFEKEWFDHFEEDEIIKRSRTHGGIINLNLNVLDLLQWLGAMNSTFFNFAVAPSQKVRILEVEQKFNPDYLLTGGVFFRVRIGS